MAVYLYEEDECPPAGLGGPGADALGVPEACKRPCGCPVSHLCLAATHSYGAPTFPLAHPFPPPTAEQALPETMALLSRMTSAAACQARASAGRGRLTLSASRAMSSVGFSVDAEAFHRDGVGVVEGFASAAERRAVQLCEAAEEEEGGEVGAVGAVPSSVYKQNAEAGRRVRVTLVTLLYVWKRGRGGVCRNACA